MYMMIAAGGLVLAGVTCCYLELHRSVRRRLEAAAVHEALSLITFLLVTIGPFAALVWLLWPTR
jgi:hypothetical protein